MAPDDSFYVSSQGAPYEVLHYSKSGTFLNVLGANDANQAPLLAPASLEFGPNGNLYVADQAGAIFQFNTHSQTQQYIAAGTLSLGYVPGAIAFAANGNLIVGNLNTQAVVQYHSTNASDFTTLIPVASGINAAAILPESNGNLLLADFSFSPLDTTHNRVVLYNAQSGTTSTFITLTQPTAPGTGAAPQPTSLLYDHDGNLLVGMSPDDFADGAIEKFNISNGAYIGTIVPNIASPSAMAFIPEPSAWILAVLGFMALVGWRLRCR